MPSGRSGEVRTRIILAVSSLGTSTHPTRMTVSIFAFISLGLVPIPFAFVRFGPALRARSRHARQAREAIARMHAQDEPEIREAEIESEEERKQPETRQCTRRVCTSV